MFVDESGANTKMTRWRGRSPGDRRGKFPFRGFHRQFVAANLADLNGRNTEQFRAFDHFYRIKRIAGDNHPALRLAEEQGVEAHRGTGLRPVIEP